MNKTEKIISFLIIFILLGLFILTILSKENKSNDTQMTNLQLTKEEVKEPEETSGKSTINVCYDEYCNIEMYLEKNLAWTTQEDGMDFCSFRWLNEEEYNLGDPILLNVLCEEYYVNDQGILTSGSGFSSPVEIEDGEAWQPLSASDDLEAQQRFGEYYQVYLDNQDADRVEFLANNKGNAETYFNDQIQYDIVDVLSNHCETDSDCVVPFDYAVQSNCLYETRCINLECSVVCPR